MNILSNSTEVFQIPFEKYQKKQNVKNRPMVGKITKHLPISAERKITTNA